MQAYTNKHTYTHNENKKGGSEEKESTDTGDKEIQKYWWQGRRKYKMRGYSNDEMKHRVVKTRWMP